MQWIEESSERKGRGRPLALLLDFFFSVLKIQLSCSVLTIPAETLPVAENFCFCLVTMLCDVAQRDETLRIQVGVVLQSIQDQTFTLSNKYNNSKKPNLVDLYSELNLIYFIEMDCMGFWFCIYLDVFIRISY